MKTSDILQHKGMEVASIHPRANLAEVVKRLVEKKIGSLLVMEGETVLGIITERDILRTCAAESRPLGEISVFERMTTDLTTCHVDDDLQELMRVMTEKRIRHLPVVEDGQLVGIVSIGDVVKSQSRILAMENEYLKHYIQS